jgi:hypothetical protein
MPGYVGSRWIRTTAAAAAALCLAAIAGKLSVGEVSALARALGPLAFVSALVAVVCLPLCSRRVYPVWMRFAARLNTVVVTGIFGACYLLIVPLFWLLRWRADPLRLRSDPRVKTYWVQRPKRDAQSFERMG